MFTARTIQKRLYFIRFACWHASSVYAAV